MTAYDPFDPAVIDDPYPYYARLREESPVARVERLDLWVLSRHADVLGALRDPATFSSVSGMGLLLGGGPPGPMRDFMRSRHGALLNDIVATGKVDEDSLSRAISDFASTFDPGIGSGAEPAVEAQADADVQTVNAANHLPEEDVARPEGE